MNILVSHHPWYSSSDYNCNNELDDWARNDTMIYNNSIKSAVISNLNIDIKKNKHDLLINSLLVDSINIKDNFTKNTFNINGLKLSKRNKSNYFFQINNLNIKNNLSIIKNQYINNIEEIFLKDISIYLEVH